MLGDDDVLTALHLRNLGVLLDEIDRLDESEKAYRDSQAALTRRLGPDHASLGSSYANLAVLYIIGGRSTIVPAETQAKLKATLPRVSIVTIPDTGHYPSEEKPAEVLALVDSFLR